jgi:hypothetical protein
VASAGGRTPATLSVSVLPVANGPFTYAWRKGCPGSGTVLSTSATLTIASPALTDAGQYEVTITDKYGCTTNCCATLTVNGGPSCSIVPPVATNCPGVSQNFTVTPTGGTAPYTISWTKNGAAFDGSSLTITAITADNGEFVVAAPVLPITIAPGETLLFTVAFAPVAPTGAKGGTVTVASTVGSTVVGVTGTAVPVRGDMNGDCVVDQVDVNIILDNRNQPASVCPACDLDGDGTITILDARIDAILCTNPGCI